jgi:2-methylcitrate dehydratase PrpD
MTISRTCADLSDQAPDEQVLERLAHWSSSLCLADVPAQVRTIARNCLIDTLGVALAGMASDVARQAAAVQEMIAAPGHSTLLGRNGGLSAPAAAYINAVAGHALDFDDNSYAGFVHGSVIVLPAALAVAQMRNLDGAALLTAFVAGVECEYALAKALTRQIYDRGWWTTGVLGSVGACAAACHALGLDASRTASALGIALAASGGLKGAFGSDAKALSAGRTSAAGVTSALLASHGSQGPRDLVEHPNGLAQMFNGGLLMPLPELGQVWGLLDPGVDLKRVPLCLSSHAAIDALREIQKLDGVAVQDIAQIVCDVPPVVIQNLVHHQPQNRQQAQFSMPFALACTAVLGDVGLADLDAQTLDREDIRTLMGRVRMCSSERWDARLLEQAPEGAWVRVLRHDGSVFENFCGNALGTAARPMNPSQVRDKFLRCSRGALTPDQARKLLFDLDNLERVPCVRDLLPTAFDVGQADS